MFDDILDDIEGVFASASWTVNNIPTFPDNYFGKIGINVNEYVRLSVLPSTSSYHSHGGKKELSGLLAVKIFTPAGEGQGRIMAVGDMLDIVLESKRLTNGTQLGTSYLQVEGLDPSNQSLYSASYFIPFKLYGE